MKRFLLQILLYGTLTLAVLGAWSAFVFFGEKALYEKGMRLPAGTRYVVLGDSESAYAFDPAETPGLVNLSAQGMSAEQYCYKFRDLVRLNPEAIRGVTVYLAVSPLRYFAAVGPMSEKAFEGRYVFLNILHAFDSLRPLAAPALLWRDRELVERTHVLTRRWRKKSKPVLNEAVGGYTHWEICGFRDDPARAAEKCAKYAAEINRSGAATRGAPAEAVFGELLAHAAAHGVRVVVFTPPYHAQVRDALEPELLAAFRARVKELAARHGAGRLDLLAFPLEDADFLDGTHVNAKGGTKLAAAVFGPEGGRK